MSLPGRPEGESTQAPNFNDTTMPVETVSAEALPSDRVAEVVEPETAVASRQSLKAEKAKTLMGVNKNLVIGSAAALLLLLGAGATYSISTAQPEVPSATSLVSAGTDNDAICESFVKSSLNCEVSWTSSETEARGTLLTQSVEAGARVDKNTAVVLNYSSGPSSSVMPNLKNKTIAEAEDALYAMNVSVAEIKEVPGGEIPKGNIVSSSVAPDAKVENGGTVTLNVSNGKVGVPNWSDKTKEFVETDAKKLGLEVNFVYEESDKASDLVLSQTPAAGEVSTADKVEVVVSKSFASKEIKVPDVIGKSAINAQAELAAAGFRHIKTVTVTNSEVTSTQVTQVVPGVGQIGKSEENLVIIVSNPSK